MRLLCVLAGLVLVLAAPSRGHAAITYLTQQRFVSATGFVNGQPEGQADQVAPNFGPFNGLRERVFSNNVGSVRATQQSSLLADRIAFQGSARATVSGGGVEAFAQSRLVVTFSLPSSSAYVITHSHLLTGMPGQRVAQAELLSSTGTVFSWLHSHADPDSWSGSPVSGVLAGGTYRLTVDTFVTRGSGPFADGTTEASVAFDMWIPAPPTLVVLAAFGLGSYRRSRVGWSN